MQTLEHSGKDQNYAILITAARSLKYIVIMKPTLFVKLWVVLSSICHHCSFWKRFSWQL